MLYVYMYNVKNVCSSLHQCFRKKGLASVYPDPKNYERFIKSQLYNFNYDRSLPITYTWPEDNPEHFNVRPLPKTLRSEGQEQRAPIVFQKH